MPKSQVVKKTKKPAAPLSHPPVSINLYRNLAGSFLIISALLFVVVGVFTLSRAKVLIARGEQVQDFDLFFNVDKSVESAEVIEGSLAETVETKKSNGRVSSGEVRPAQAAGSVIIYNKRAVGQTLIPTTRLLSPDGHLFRLKNRVIIPAQGQIEAEVYADKSGKEEEIGPTTFTIPGLPADLQKRIYAESRETMRDGEVSISSLNQVDVDRAYHDLSQILDDAGKAKLQDKLGVLAPSDPHYIYKSEILEQSTDAKLGQEVSSFEVKQTAHIIGMVFSRRELLSRVQSSLESLISKDTILLPVDFDDLTISIAEADIKLGQARLKVTAGARTRLSLGTPELAKERLFGLTKEGARRYLQGVDGIASFEIKMPFYMKRIPKNPSRVMIGVK